MSAVSIALGKPASAILPEDLARADMYALIANLFYRPPTNELLAALLSAGELEGVGDSELHNAWRELQSAAKAANPAELKEEFDALFISTGQAPVLPYESYYRSGFLNEKPVVELIDDLRKMGLARRESVSEPEDHIAALCDVMRLLILGGEGPGPSSLEAQKKFFDRHIKPWYGRLTQDIACAVEAEFYRRVARFAQAFLDVESESFDID